MPEKVALIGFDNTSISKEVSPTLTSVAQPIGKIVKQSIQIIIDKINQKQKTKNKKQRRNI